VSADPSPASPMRATSAPPSRPWHQQEEGPASRRSTTSESGAGERRADGGAGAGGGPHGPSSRMKRGGEPGSRGQGKTDGREERGGVQTKGTAARLLEEGRGEGGVDVNDRRPRMTWRGAATGRTRTRTQSTPRHPGRALLRLLSCPVPHGHDSRPHQAPPPSPRR
jgi:hypothetical protein